MKTFFILLFAFSSTLTFAGLPITCVTRERLGDRPIMKFKINDKVNHEDTRGNVWKHYLIGITPAEGFRKISYASGVVLDSSIGLTFVEKDFVIGKASAAFDKKLKVYNGTASISHVDRGHEYEIKCAPQESLDLLL